MEFRRPKSRRHRSHLLVKECLGLCHESAQRFGITLRHILDGSIHYLQIIFSQGLMLCTLRITIRERIGFIQVREDFDGIFLSTEIGKHPVQMLLDVQRAHLYLITIECHQVGLDTKGTGLIQTTTTTTGTEFTDIGNIHLTQCVEVQII